MIEIDNHTLEHFYLGEVRMETRNITLMRLRQKAWTLFNLYGAQGSHKNKQTTKKPKDLVTSYNWDTEFFNRNKMQKNNGVLGHKEVSWDMSDRKEELLLAGVMPAGLMEYTLDLAISFSSPALWPEEQRAVV